MLVISRERNKVLATHPVLGEIRKSTKRQLLLLLHIILRIAESRRGSLWQDLKCSKIISFFVVHRLDTFSERALGLPNIVIQIFNEGVTGLLELFEFDHNGLLE